MKILGLLALCTCFSAAAHAKMPQAEAPAEQNVKIDSIVVTGARYASDIRHLPMTVSVVGREQIERSRQASLLPSLTEQVPGLFVTARGVMGYGVSDGAAGGMSLRGIGAGSAAQLLVLIDGHPQYMGLFGHPISDAYQSMLAERVEVLRGPASVLYGSNAMGGVVNIVTRQQKEDGVKTGLNAGYGSYNTLQTELTNRIRKGRFSSIAAGSYNRTDGHRADMGFEQYGGYVKLGYDFGTHWNAFADVNLTHFNASNPGTVTARIYDNDSRITRGMASFSLENDYGRSSGALKFFYNWGRHRIDDGYQPGEEPLDYRFNSRDEMLGVSLYQSVSLFRGNRLTAGVDYQHFGGRAWNRYVTDGHREQLSDKAEDEAAGYVDFRQTLGRFTIDAGVRADYHTRSGLEWVPQAGVAFRPAGNAELKATAGKGFRNPTIRELYMFRPANPDLEPERLWSYELAWSHRPAAGALSYGVNFYYIKGDNIILPLIIDGRRLNVNSGRIENWGAEANVAWRIGRAWTLSANYSWLNMEHPVAGAPGHKLFAGADFVRGRWALSTGVQYIAGLYTATAPAAQEEFVLWNLRASLRVNRRLTLYARGENLLAQRYEINAGYPMPRATLFGGVSLDF